MTVTSLLTRNGLYEVSESSACFISYSLDGKLAYIGACSPSDVDRAVKKLDTLFRYYVRLPP